MNPSPQPPLHPNKQTNKLTDTSPPPPPPCTPPPPHPQSANTAPHLPPTPQRSILPPQTKEKGKKEKGKKEKRKPSLTHTTAHQTFAPAAPRRLLPPVRPPQLTAPAPTHGRSKPVRIRQLPASLPRAAASADHRRTGAVRGAPQAARAGAGAPHGTRVDAAAAGGGAARRDACADHGRAEVGRGARWWREQAVGCGGMV